MSLTSLSNNTLVRLQSKRIATLLWISVGALFVLLFAATLFGRLGLPAALISFGLLLVAGATIIVLSWFGRTMTSAHYFFAERTVSSATSGFSGGADWVGGAFVISFIALDSAGRAVLSSSLMVGALLMAILFAPAFYRSGVSTLAGYFSWRFPRTGSGFIAIPITSLILLPLMIVEFAIARDVLTLLIPAPLENIAWAILFLAVVPILFGGWLSLIFVNLVLVLAVLVCVLVPTLLLGIIPGVLEIDAGLLQNSPDIDILSKPNMPELTSGSFLSLLGTMTVLAAGFSVLPHTISRLALVERPVAAQEHVGWAALFAFVTVSTAPLTFGVIMGNDQSSLDLLTTQPVLHIMPYIALLLLAYNSLTATLMAFSGGLVRGVQRSRNLDPGERSMFGTRLVTVVAASFIGWFFASSSLPVFQLFLLVLALGASTLFVPLAAAVWLARIPGYFYGLSILVGMITFALMSISSLSTSSAEGISITAVLEIISGIIPATIVSAALFSMAGAAIVLLMGMALGAIKPEIVNDQMLGIARENR